MKDKKDNTKSSGLPIGMCLGISIGTAIGAATNNIGLWIPIGLSIGLCLGLVLGRSNKEIGFCNLAFGIMGIISLFNQNYRKPAALANAIFLSGAALLHIHRIATIQFGKLTS